MRFLQKNVIMINIICRDVTVLNVKMKNGVLSI